MAEIIGAPVPPLPPPSRKNNTWLIVLVAILVLCCCCVSAIGLLITFGEDILNELGIYVFAPAQSALI